MARALHHHEQKLVKHTDLVGWSRRRRELAVLRRYHVQNTHDYHRYNTLCGSLKAFAHRIALLSPTDPARARFTSSLLSKLYDIGLLNAQAALSDVDNKLSVAAFCRRRLPVVMCMLKMAQTVSAATRFIEQGHVRVGPHTITDPAFLVTRHMQDFVTWVDASKLKRTLLQYNDQLDDFLLL
ncbi:U3 small nucleolar ribonucleoprotein imp3 [Leucoagaricus gongylophorus]